MPNINYIYTRCLRLIQLSSIYSDRTPISVAVGLRATSNNIDDIRFAKIN